MKLGAVEYITKGADDIATFLTAKRVGLEGVEVMITRQELVAPGQERLGSLKRAKAVSGLEIPSLMLPEHNFERGIARSEPALVQEAIEDIRYAIDWAAELGADVILVPFFGRAEIVTRADFERAVRGFREVCPFALAKGGKLCYEGTLPAHEIRGLAEQIDSEAFGCYFDVGNIVWLGMDTATEIRGLGSLIKQVHMKDARVGLSDCPMGLGRVNYLESVKALREIDYDGWIVGEFSQYPDHPGVPTPPPELVARDVSFTQFWFPELRRAAWPRLGAMSWEFKRGELERMIETFKRYGLNTVQLCGELLEETAENPAAIPGIREKLETNGITVAGLGGYRNLITPDPDQRRANIGFLKRCLEVAPLFGTSVVTTGAGTRNPEGDGLPSHENRGQEAWGLLRAALDELLPVAEAHGSILAMEGWVNHVLRSEGQLTRLLDEYPTNHPQVVLDPYNYMSKHLLPASERIVRDFLNRFEHRFVLAHLKDISPEGAEVEHLEFGYGVFPQKIYLDFLRTRRPDLPIILEHLLLDHIPAAIHRLQEFVEVEL